MLTMLPFGLNDFNVTLLALSSANGLCTAESGKKDGRCLLELFSIFYKYNNASIPRF